MQQKLLLAIGITATLFASCKKDDDNNPIIAQKVPYTSLTPTTSYFNTFRGADSNTTVDFSGQTTRISMLAEMDAYMKTGINSEVKAAQLKDMFVHQNSPFNAAALNAASDKTIASKTAASFSTVDANAERTRFNSWFDAIAGASLSNNQTAAMGNAGLLDGKYLVDAKGFEYGQFIQKGLMGAMMLDQISNVYLGNEKMSADNKAIVSGKNYTQMEHHWDEAYGYLTKNDYFPKKDRNDATKWLESYLGNYVRQVNGVYGDPAAVYMAFLKGRAAIVNSDMTTRNEQISIIRQSLEKAVATIGISYLNKTKTATSDGARFHSLSEGVGFIYSLRFAHDAKINKTLSDELLNMLMNKPNGFWDLTNADIDAVRNQIADALGINREAVVNH
ncbi:MAG TPA: DUF4856 domain-containing protein [Flavipsychrobacter sp.]|nr:DUF4856 domain-containing protein [Flavipsychrobacter sp.]